MKSESKKPKKSASKPKSKSIPAKSKPASKAVQRKSPAAKPAAKLKVTAKSTQAKPAARKTTARRKPVSRRTSTKLSAASELKPKLKPASEPPKPAPRTIEPRSEGLPTRTASARHAPASIPPLLLEGDSASDVTSVPSGPGERYALGPFAPGVHVSALSTAVDLPASYGTGRLFLTARDSHWLYAAWDLDPEQQREFNARASDGHLIVRIFLNEAEGDPFSETHVHPESRSWFIHVGRGGARFVAELGFRDRTGRWQHVAVSPATVTPPDQVSEDFTVQFATLPPEVKFEEVLQAVREAIPTHVPLIEAVQKLRAEGHAELPSISAATGLPSGSQTGVSQEALARHEPPVSPTRKPAPLLPEGVRVGPARVDTDWTAAQREALARVVKLDTERRVWIGSLEITELIRRQLREEMASLAALERARGEQPPGAGPAGISSPLGGAARPRGFWFNINTELIVYGATEPGARVSIAGREIKLRRDGTFSFRFALPDGDYELPVAAESPDREETRSAHLRFRRATDYHGHVAAHPQDPALRPPAPAHVA